MKTWNVYSGSDELLLAGVRAATEAEAVEEMFRRTGRPTDDGAGYVYSRTEYAEEVQT